MADHSFFGTLSVSEAASASDDVTRKGEVDAAVAAVQAAADAALDRANHTGTQSADTVVDGTTNHVFTAADDTKLAGVAAGATANQADSYLLDRSNHTGTQPVASLSDFTAEVNALIQNVVDAAPTALDTLNELAAALGDDPNFAATVTGLISALDTRVDDLEANSGTGAYKTTIGDGSTSLFTLTHGLSSTDVDVIVRRLSDGQRVFPVDKAPDADTVTVDFGSTVPPANSYRVLVVPA